MGDRHGDARLERDWRNLVRFVAEGTHRMTRRSWLRGPATTCRRNYRSVAFSFEIQA